MLEFFRPKCWFRQGDPLLPFLFVLLTEVLTRLTNRDELLGLIHGIKIARQALPISNGLFAYDIMLFCRANPGEVRHLKKCVDTFARWSGQVVNPRKSFLLFSSNLTQERRDQLIAIMRLSSVSSTGSYLGAPLCVPRSKSLACREVQDEVVKRLAGWKARALSQATRSVLLQSVA